jgi:hypothetical protein
MIVHKTWIAANKFYGRGLKRRDNAGKQWQREGWYLFGLIPLYVRDVTQRGVFYR